MLPLTEVLRKCKFQDEGNQVQPPQKQVVAAAPAAGGILVDALLELGK